MLTSNSPTWDLKIANCANQRKALTWLNIESKICHCWKIRRLQKYASMWKVLEISTNDKSWKDYRITKCTRDCFELIWKRHKAIDVCEMQWLLWIPNGTRHEIILRSWWNESSKYIFSLLTFRSRSSWGKLRKWACNFNH